MIKLHIVLYLLIMDTDFVLFAVRLCVYVKWIFVAMLQMRRQAPVYFKFTHISLIKSLND